MSEKKPGCSLKFDTMDPPDVRTVRLERGSRNLWGVESWDFDGPPDQWKVGSVTGKGQFAKLKILPGMYLVRVDLFDMDSAASTPDDVFEQNRKALGTTD